jgi:hypothetical protein
LTARAVAPFQMGRQRTVIRMRNSTPGPEKPVGVTHASMNCCTIG